jgi:2'-5' RNA ligase
VRDQAAEYAAAWATFEGLERVSPHRADWAAWAASHGRHTLFMALVRDPAALAAIGNVQRCLAGIAGLELHARHFFHISIQSCGFDDALALDDARLRAALSASPSFEVVLGGVNAFRSAVFLETHSDGQLLELRHRLRGAIGPALEAIDPHPDFLFHLTLGYLGQGTLVQKLREVIRPLRECETVRVRIDRLDLVQVPTDQRVAYPRLEPFRSFELAGA